MLLGSDYEFVKLQLENKVFPYPNKHISKSVIHF